VRRARWLLAVAIVACVGNARRARAQEVALDLSACSVPAAEEVRALASVELRDRLLTIEASAQASVPRFTVAVRCDERTASLLVRESGAERTVDLASVPPPLRARLLALSIAELTTDMAEGRSEPARAVLPVPAAPITRRRVTVALSAGAQLAPLLGVLGSLSVWLMWRGPLRLYTSVDVGHARAPLDGGQVSMSTVALRAGPALAFERGRFEATVGLGVRAARHQFRGQPARAGAARSFSTLSLAPTAFVALQLRLTRHFLWLIDAGLTHQLRETRLEVRGGSPRVLSALETAVRSGVGVTW
jgi:hypothetical protein